MPYRKESTPFQRAISGLLTQGIPQYAGYKLQQQHQERERVEKEKQRKLDWKELEETWKHEQKMFAIGQKWRILQDPKQEKGLRMQAAEELRQEGFADVLEQLSTQTPQQKPMTPYQQQSLQMRRKGSQRATDMDLINNYYSKEGDKFIMPDDVAKMIEPRVREASMRQFGRFAPRLPAEVRPGPFRKNLPQRFGTMQLGMPTTQKAERVRVKSPDGTIGTIPANQLEEALRNGYKRVK